MCLFWRSVMAKRKRKTNKARALLSVIAVIALIIISYFTEPWQYLDGGLGNRDSASATDLQVHYIDVGQADSILVTVPADKGNRYMLIDAGTSSGYPASTVVDYLKNEGIAALDYFIITHPHLDHIGAADEVINEFNVKNVIMPECEASTASWLRVLTAMDNKGISYIPSKCGDTYSMGEAEFQILGPVDASKVDPDDKNDYSVVIKLEWGDTSFLFTGDAEKTSEAEMLKKFPSETFRADVLKMGHHGSTTSSSKAFLDAVRPSTAVICVGKGNDYGHPHKETLENLKARNITVLRTDEEGTIILCSDKKTVSRLTK